MNDPEKMRQAIGFAQQSFELRHDYLTSIKIRLPHDKGLVEALEKDGIGDFIEQGLFVDHDAVYSRLNNPRSATRNYLIAQSIERNTIDTSPVSRI